jgi:hypothetical protein
MKFCVDCNHYVRQEMVELTYRTDNFKEFKYHEHRCASPRILPDLITGIPNHRLCEENRSHEIGGVEHCGKLGLWFEEKASNQ